VAGNTVTAQNIDKPWTHVTVYDMPYEMDDDILKIKLEKYGKVISIRRGKIHGTEVENGLRHARIYIDEPIPSFLRVGKITFFPLSSSLLWHLLCCVSQHLSRCG
jgi:hypothetical protein